MGEEVGGGLASVGHLCLYGDILQLAPACVCVCAAISAKKCIQTDGVLGVGKPAFNRKIDFTFKSVFSAISRPRQSCATHCLVQFHDKPDAPCPGKGEALFPTSEPVYEAISYTVLIALPSISPAEDADCMGCGGRYCT